MVKTACNRSWLSPVGLLFAAALVSLAPPAIAQSQSAGSTIPVTPELAKRHVTLNVESVALSRAVRALMDSVQANYTIDSALNRALVTVHFSDVLFPDALQALLKASTMPVACTLEDGIYQLAPAPPPAPALASKPADPASTLPPFHLEKITLQYADPRDILQILGGTPFQVNGQQFGLIGGSAGGRWGEGGMGGSISGFGNYTNQTITPGGIFGNSTQTIIGTPGSRSGSSFNLPLGLIGGLLGGGR